MKLALCSRANSPEQPTYARIYRTPIKRALGEVWLNVARFTAFLLPPFFPPSSFFPLSLPLFSLVFSSFSSVDRSRALPLPLSIARHRYRGSGSILLAMGPITGEGRGERLLETNRWKFFSVFLLYYRGFMIESVSYYTMEILRIHLGGIWAECCFYFFVNLECGRVRGNFVSLFFLFLLPRVNRANLRFQEFLELKKVHRPPCSAINRSPPLGGFDIIGFSCSRRGKKSRKDR